MPRTFNLTTGQGGWVRRVACLIVATLVAAAPIPPPPRRPLGALRSGDQLRASEDAAAVVVLSGGRGSVMVTAARSPYAVPAPDAGPTPSEKLKTLMQSSLGFLLGRTR